MPAIIVIVAATAVIYFIFFLEESASRKQRKPKPERRPYPTKLTLSMFGIIFLPIIITTLVLRWNHSISLDMLTESELHFAIFRMTTLYDYLVWGLMILPTGFYIYATLIRDYWAYFIGVPFQACTLMMVVGILMLQPHIEIFQSFDVDETTYHLVYQRDVSGAVYLLSCERDIICDSILLGFTDSYPYSAGQMAYHPAYNYLHIRTTSHSVEDYIIPIDGDK